ncbi:hypothetical protein SCUP234_05469 [Seiridium cupressi]
MLTIISFSGDEVLNERWSKRKTRKAIEKGLRSGDGQKRGGRDDSDTSISINKSSDSDWKPQRKRRIYLSDSASEDDPPKRRTTKEPRSVRGNVRGDRSRRHPKDLKEHIGGKRQKEDSRKDPPEDHPNEASGNENLKKDEDGDKKTESSGKNPSSGPVGNDSNGDIRGDEDQVADDQADNGNDNINGNSDNNDDSLAKRQPWTIVPLDGWTPIMGSFSPTEQLHLAEMTPKLVVDSPIPNIFTLNADAQLRWQRNEDDSPQPELVLHRADEWSYHPNIIEPILRSQEAVLKEQIDDGRATYTGSILNGQ